MRETLVLALYWSVPASAARALIRVADEGYTLSYFIAAAMLCGFAALALHRTLVPPSPR